MHSFFYIYLPLAIAFIIIYFIKNPKTKILFVLLLIVALLLKPIESVIYAQKVKYNEQKEIVKKYIPSNPNESAGISP